ncbi:MAG TPA: VTT domain-containing protein [Polyangiaceae bacterium]|nr:VTT domain-containing protein [Polyangiaceae bacterium]
MTTLLEPGVTCWRVERADRFAMLIDGAAYFRALYESIPQARSSILLLGWDIDRRTVLVPRETADEPVELGARLDQVARRHHRLRVHVLCWDATIVYALERPWLMAQRWKVDGHRRVRFHPDCAHPFGASHHQKVVVIDDALAFAGGLDITSHRWDTPEHAQYDPWRKLPSGIPYGPFHDVQCAVDGAAARALGDLVRLRWEACTCEKLRPLTRVTTPAPWPASTEPWIEDVPVGILRTHPAHDRLEPANEIARFTERAFAAARERIYIESMYLTSQAIGRALCERLREPDGPEIVIVLSEKSEGWLEHNTMDALRDGLLRELHAADRHGRLGVYFPRLGGSKSLTLHSKVMVIDDEVLRIGSANLTNRSLSLDTECDVATEASGRDDVRAACRRARHALVAEHLGVKQKVLAEAERELGSLNAAITALASDSGRTLSHIHTAETPSVAFSETALALADPMEPIDANELVSDLVGPEERRRVPRRALALGAITLLVLVCAALWQLTDLGDRGTAVVEGWLAHAPRSMLFISVTVLLFAALTSLGLPVTVAIGACALTLGTWIGFVVAALGSFTSSVVGYSLGRALGGEFVERQSNRSVESIKNALRKGGILSIVTLRVIPVAPFAVVNMAAGAARVSARDFVIGTVVAMTPGILGLSVLIDRIMAALRHPTFGAWTVVGALLLAMAALFAGIMKWARRRRQSVPNAS